MSSFAKIITAILFFAIPATAAEINGPLNNALLQQLSADPVTNVLESRIYYNTTTDKAVYRDAAAWRTFADTSSAQTMTSKTLTGAVLNDYVDVNEESAPSTPGAGVIRVYGKSDRKVYKKDSTGLESELGGGGGAGEINVIANSSESTNWTVSGAGIAIATTSTASDLPLDGVIATAIKITPSSGTNYAKYCWTMPASLKNRKLKVQQEQRPLSGYASGDLKLDIYTHATVGCGGAAVRQNLSTDVSSVSGIPNLTGRYTTTFDTDSSDFYGIRYTRVAGTTALNLAGVVVGPGIQPQGAAVGLIPWTPTGSWVSGTTTYSGKASRSGNLLSGTVYIAQTGAPTSTSLTINMPTGLTIDQTGYANNSSNTITVVGDAKIRDASPSALYLGTVEVDPSNNAIMVVRFAAQSVNTVTTIDASSNNVTQIAPFTFATGDYVTVSFENIPIAEWAGSGTVNLGENVPEFACWDGAKTVFGANGCLIPTITAVADNTTTDHTITLGTNLPDNYIPEVQVLTAGGDGVWHSVGSDQGYDDLIQMYTATGSTRRNYGIGISRITSSKSSFNVRYGNAGTVPSQTFVASQNYPQAAGDRYRVAFTKKGEAVGFGLASATQSGLIPTYVKGIFTPSLVKSGGAGTLGANTTVTASYVKVGSICHVELVITPITVTVGTVNLTFTLPFAAKNLSRAYINTLDNSTANNGRVILTAGSATAELTPSISSSSWAISAAASSVYAHFSYEVNE